MKSRRQPWLRVLLAAAVFLILGIFYFRVGLFPGSLRENVFEKIEFWTGKKVLFSRVVFVPFHGLSLYDVGVFEKDGSPLFRAKRITLNAQLLPFLREKRIIVNRCLLQQPVLDWSLEDHPHAKPVEPPKTVLSGQISVPTVASPKSVTLEGLSEGPDFFLPENVYLQRIEISDGRLTIRANKNSEPIECISSVNLRMSLPHPPLLRFEGRLELGEKPYAFVNFTGVWDLNRGRYEFSLKSSTDRIPNWLLDYQKKHFLILKEGAVTLDTKLISGEGSSILFKTKAALRNAVLHLEPAVYSGQMRLDAEGVFDTTWKRFDQYHGTLELIRVQAEHVSSSIDALDDLSGTLRFEPDLLVVHSISGSYKKVTFQGSGTLRSFKDLKVEGEIRSHMTMEEVRALLSEEQKKAIQDFILTGDCQALTLLRGSLKKTSKLETEHKLVIQNGSIRNEAKKLFWTHLSGELASGSDGTHIRRASFLMNEKPYSLDLFIPKETTQPGNFHLKSSDLDLKAQYRLKSDDLILNDGEASLWGLHAIFSGKCLHWTQPMLDLTGTVSANLGAFTKTLSGQNQSLPTIKVDGVLSGPFTLKGTWDQPALWDVQMDASGSPVRWDSWFLLENVQTQVRMSGQKLELPFFHADAYGGTLRLDLSASFANPSFPFQAEAYVNNFDLARLAKDKIPPDEKLKGILIGKTSLAGDFKNSKSYRGSGVFSITKGLLWQTSQFKAMGHLPLVKVEGLDLVTFEEMNATFDIHDEKIWTQDLSLLGDSVDLSLKGSIGFDQRLDFVMDIQFSEEVFQGAALTGGLAPLMVQEAANFISQYRVTGTLKEPKYEKMLLPTGRSMGRRLGGLVKGLTI